MRSESSKLLIVMDGKFEWCDGRAWSSHMHYDRFSSRYLHVFSNLEILARAYQVEEPNGKEVCGVGTEFVRIGSYRGAVQFLLQFPRILVRAFRTAFSSHPVLFYLPGTLPILFALIRIALGRKIYAFVVADPDDQLSKLALSHPLRPLVQKLFKWLTKFILARAFVARYVTQSYLQSKYPARSPKAEFAISDVDLNDEDFVKTSRNSQSFGSPTKTITYVAMFAQRYKAHDVLIEAVRICAKNGHKLNVRLVGDGQNRHAIEQIVSANELSDEVAFVGSVQSGAAMREELDKADLFVMPSRAEGLPRAMLEAMARGLPVVSTDVGGVPELIDSSMLVPVEDPEALAKKIMHALLDQDELARQSKRNLKIAQSFRKEILQSREETFLREILADSQ